MSFDFAYALKTLLLLARYIPVTLEITVLSVLIGLVLGLFITIGQLVKNRAINALAVAYVAFIRGTPALLLIMLVYYGLPLPLAALGLDINGFPQIGFAILAVSLNSAGYMSESMRSAYAAVDRGQYEAGLAVGMSEAAVNRQIIIPQACVMALPNIGNQIVSAIKHSALVYAIGIADVFQEAQALANFTLGLHQAEIFIVVTAIYWLISVLSEAGVNRVERRFRHLIP